MKCFLHLCKAEAFDEKTAGIKSTTPTPTNCKHKSFGHLP